MKLQKLFVSLTELVAVSVAVSNNPPFHNFTLRSSNFNISARWDAPPAASDDLWNTAKSKGANLLDIMSSSDAYAGQLYVPPRVTAQSPFSDIISDLSKWGYTHETCTDPFDCDLDQYWGLGDALEALVVGRKSTMEEGPIICYTIYHSDNKKVDENGNPIPTEQQTYDVNGRTYRATGAQNDIAIDPINGVFFATNMESPKHAAAKLWHTDPNPEDLPALHAFSDIMWGAWNFNVPPSHFSTIQYYFSVSVTNPSSAAIIKRAMDSVRATLDVWPGTSFGMDTEAGKALLGSPNGRSIAYLLGQHKAELGIKWVTKVSVFHGENSEYAPVLLFYVEDLVGEPRPGR